MTTRHPQSKISSTHLTVILRLWMGRNGCILLETPPRRLTTYQYRARSSEIAVQSSPKSRPSTRRGKSFRKATMWSPEPILTRAMAFQPLKFYSMRMGYALRTSALSTRKRSPFRLPCLRSHPRKIYWVQMRRRSTFCAPSMTPQNSSSSRSTNNPPRRSNKD